MTMRDAVGARHAVLFFLVLFLSLGAMAWAQQEEPVWKWTPEQIQQHVNKVRSGKNLTPKQWPNGAKVAVSLSFDFDTEPVWLGFQKQQSPSYMSRGEYGARAGMPRILALLDRHKIPATFFIPAMSMVLHLSRGHQIYPVEISQVSSRSAEAERAKGNLEYAIFPQ